MLTGPFSFVSISSFRMASSICFFVLNLYSLDDKFQNESLWPLYQLVVYTDNYGSVKM
jgi:hypothetical protein